MPHLNALRYVLEGSFCSFRNPIGAKYQATFWFPPKTTVVGFVGCALGLEPPDLEPLYDSLNVGVVLESWGGSARDLWGFTKLKGSAKPESAVVLRELIYEPCYVFYIASNESQQLEELREALLDPVYPLRFGRGEDLAMLRGKPEVISLSSVDNSPWLRWTLLPSALQDIECTLEPLDSESRPNRPPLPTQMPIRLRYDKNWIRKAEMISVTQVFDWGVRPTSPERLWTDGRYTIYLI